MRIDYLKLENFGIIKNTELYFEENTIYLLCGNNGEGKSTVIKALSLLLFDHCEGNLIDYINWTSDYFNLEIKFEHLGKYFTQTFYYDQKKVSKRELQIKDNHDIINSYKNSDATKILASIIDPKFSLASVIIFEGEIDLIKTKPAERREQLKKIYDLDFSQGINDLDLQQKAIEKELVEINKQIYLYENKSYVQKDLITLNISEDTYLNQKTEKIKLEEELRNLKLFDEKKKEFETNLKALNEKLIAKRSEYNLIKNEQDKLLRSKQKTLDLFEIEKDNFLKSIQDIDKNINLKEKELSDLNNIPIRRKKSIFYDEIKHKELQDLKIELETNLKHLLKEKDNYKNGKCPTCGKDFTVEVVNDCDNKIKDHENRLKSINNDLFILQEQKQEKKKEEQKEIDSKNKLVENKQILSNQLQELLSSKNMLNTKFNIKKESYDKFVLEYSTKDNTIKLDYLNKEIETIESDIKINQESVFDYEKMNNSYLQDLNRLSEQLVKIEKEIHDYEVTLSLNIQIKKDNDELLEQKEKDTIILQELKNKEKNYLQEIDVFKKGKAILQKEFPNYVLQNMVASLENDMNEFLEKTYESRYTLKIVDKKDQLYIMYGDGNIEADVKLASGYEKQLFSLAWKYALSKKQSLNILVLDECDAQSSEENSEKLYDILGSMKNNNLYNQLFIVTHKENTKQFLESNYNAKILMVEKGKIN